MTHALKFRDVHISLAHGNGGRMMRELIEHLFVPALANPQLDTAADAVSLPIPAGHELVVTTDGFTVQPLEFPGGNIGSLAVHGTVNDLAVSGAVPRYMTLSVFLEEGLEIARLRRVIDELGNAARDCGVAQQAFRVGWRSVQSRDVHTHGMRQQRRAKGAVRRVEHAAQRRRKSVHRA